MYIETTEKLLEFIEKSPTAFQAVDEMKNDLRKVDFRCFRRENTGISYRVENM